MNRRPIATPRRVEVSLTRKEVDMLLSAIVYTEATEEWFQTHRVQDWLALERAKAKLQAVR